MEMIGRIKIKCPNCGVVLEAQDNPANAQKSVICPNCKVRNRFIDFRRFSQKTVDDETYISFLTKESSVGHLVDEATRREYPLTEGRSLVGRKPAKESPKADIPIETSDRGFSRAHLFIDAVKGRDGRYHIYVSNADNKNETFVNGQKLPGGDRIGLSDGDRISSSSTILRFIKAKVSDETQL